MIALAFVLAILITSFFSRWLRSTELRFEGFAFADEPSRPAGQEICRLPAKILVPHRPGVVSLAEKSAAIEREFHLDPRDAGDFRAGRNWAIRAIFIRRR